jgi:hypothetical protein
MYESEVIAVGAEWTTDITISGTYNGPTDVVAVEEYEVEWTSDGETLFEEGAATLVLASGGSLRSLWSSSISPTNPRFAGFPPGGETINVEVSPFEIDGNEMTYEWTGTVRASARQGYAAAK